MNDKAKDQAAFIEEPLVKIGKKSEFITVGRLVYFSELYGIVTVPDGFPTDFASIPRIFRALHPVNGKHRLAAVVHDYLCRDDITPRKTADKVFNEAMKVLKVKRWRRRQFYVAVRLGGIFGRKKK